ncbi:MAG: D-alanine--D-alanine ligase [Nitrospira sp.]|nr:MAG: D-alanine--D-alanine ligase [Nitrospira sp.]
MKRGLTEARIGVLMGGRSAERDVSLRTGQAVHQALLRRGYDAVAIDVDETVCDQLRVHRVQLAFLSLHGPGGEDGTIQGLLESIGVPYTGSGVAASAMAMNKSTTKALLAYHGIPVPAGVVVQTAQARSNSRMPTGVRCPFVVKPVDQGSTIGVTIVRRPSEWATALRRAQPFGREAVAESFIPGREVTVSVLQGRKGPAALPLVEIVVTEGFYDFDAKYQKGRTKYLCPAPMPAALTKQLQALGARAFEVLGCEGAARVDIRVTPRGKPYVLEVNTIPGMTETSLLPMAAKQAGLDYDQLVERILESALSRMRKAHRDR